MFEFGNLTMTDLTEVRFLRVKTPNQPVGMLIQAALPEMVRPRNKLSESIGFNVSESGDHGFRTFIGQLLNDNGF
ncbi:hypothetical protein EWM60_02435 [Candidatus Erwinia dacicola]|nr:hypothetical protein [Candidatus Erwinia dacicola]NJC99854.1 hypothetical protein [Candidatus Erwinia dacicola]NJD84903.1 hypothetical protein [Candidatus Erwinia dacicola]